MSAQKISIQGIFPQLPGTTWDHLERILARFHHAWQTGKSPSLEDFLDGSDAQRQALLIKLVHADLQYRLRRGETVRVEPYLQRYQQLQEDARVVLLLIRTEFRLRRALEPSLTVEEYQRRFPPYRATLTQSFLEAASQPSPKAGPPAPPKVSPPAQAGHQTQTEEPVTRAFDHPVPTVTLPDPFGPYRIQRLLSQGGMGAVYLAHDSRLDRLVALKVPHFSPQDGVAVVERFQRAAQAAARLAHPNLCPIYEVGEFQGIPYLTMPYLEIPSLAARLQEGQPLTPPQSAALVHRLAVALQAAHEAGIIHRDLNPGNILLNSDGEPIIVDFGLVRQLDTDTARLTKTGQMLGTPGYTAPEQLSGVIDSQSQSCDIFSLGVILYELLTGELPFGRSLQEVLLRIMTRDPVPPSVVHKGVDPLLETVCLKAMARKVEDRYPSMAEMAAALVGYLRKQQQPVEQILAGVNEGMPEALVAEDESEENQSIVIRPARTTEKDVMLRGADKRDGKAPSAQQQSAEAKSQVKGDYDLSRLRSRPAPWYRRPTFWLVGAGVVVAGVLLTRFLLRPLGQGSVQITLDNPAAEVEVRVDDVLLAKQELGEPFRLMPGEHQVAVTGKEYEPVNQRIAVRPGKDLVLHISLTKADQRQAHAQDPPPPKVEPNKAIPAGDPKVPVGPQPVLITKDTFTIKGHNEVATSVAFNPDSKSLVSGGRDSMIRIWDVEKGSEILGFKGHSDYVNCVAYSPDGTRIISGGKEKNREGLLFHGVIRIRDVAKGIEIQSVKGPEDQVLSLALSPDGKRIVGSFYGSRVKVWNADTGTEIFSLTGPRNIFKVAFSPDGKRLACTGGIWDDQQRKTTSGEINV